MTLPVRARKVFAALPDGVTSFVFLATWVAPGRGESTIVKNLVLTMLVEFLLIHANGFMMGPLASSESTRLKRARIVLGISVFYAVFIGAFCFAFDAVWPLFLFGWLIASKLLFALTDKDSGAERRHQATLWAASAGFYIGGALLTAMVPLPRLGITEPGAAYGISGSGIWVDTPHVAIALGALYFGALAWLKYVLVAEHSPRRVAWPPASRP